MISASKFYVYYTCTLTSLQTPSAFLEEFELVSTALAFIDQKKEECKEDWRFKIKLIYGKEVRLENITS